MLCVPAQRRDNSYCYAKPSIRAQLCFSNIYLKGGQYTSVQLLARQYYWYVHRSSTGTWSLEQVKPNHSLSLSLLLCRKVNIFLFSRRTYQHLGRFLEVFLWPHLFLHALIWICSLCYPILFICVVRHSNQCHKLDQKVLLLVVMDVK